MSNTVLTPVINSYDDELLFLDLSNPVLLEKGSISYDDALEMKVITNYRDIDDELNLEDADDDDIKAYFVERCNKASGYGTEILHDLGYEHIYGVLKEASFTFKMLIKDMAAIIMSWRQGSPEDVLYDLDIEHSDFSPEDKHSLAWNALNESDSMNFETSYKVGDDVLMLYSIS